jgi:hypothetical protein
MRTVHPIRRTEGSSRVNLLSDLKRWADGILLDSVSRGQEFVLDCDDYPEAQVWLRSLFCVQNIAATNFEKAVSKTANAFGANMGEL